MFPRDLRADQSPHSAAGDKPDWFLNISPRGKVPVLKVGDDTLFESAAIVEYLDEVNAPRLHPENPIIRARHRAWMEFGSAVLMDNWNIVTAKDQGSLDAAVTAVREKLARIEQKLGDGPWFAGQDFTIVDTVFAPVLRYCEVFDLDILEGLPKVRAWRDALLARLSAIAAAPSDFTDRLRGFMRRKGGLLADMDKAA